MTDAPQPRLDSGHESEGRPAAIIAWALYILSIPSATLLVIVGLIVAYAGRGTATGLPRQHIEAQLALFWSVFWWTVACWVGIAISIPLMVIGVGILTLCLCALALFVLHVWFTIKSILSLVNLLSDKAP
ncbi:MAG: hypothetical protein EBR82_13375 [Caulobacteraceae bacterium]|nr:hypothetical protein [Caulobacteraceae bacterium]